MNIKLINDAVSAFRLKATGKVSIASKMKIENMGIFAALVFYAVVGIILFVLLPLSDYPPHIGVMGVLSLVTAYGLFKKRNWSLWTVIILFFVMTTFSAFTLYWFFGKDLLFTMGAIALMVLTWVFTVYTSMKRAVLTH